MAQITVAQKKKPHAIYRVYDSSRNLLYIGCSVCPLTRAADHVMHQTWRKRVAFIKVDWKNDWYEARDAEKKAIKEENPMWNFQHKGPDRKRKVGIYHPQYKEDDEDTWVHPNDADQDRSAS